METATKADRRIARTKEAIKKAFLELISEKEFNQITINDIADRANVNRGTVYLHYMDKYDLNQKIIDDLLNEMLSACPYMIAVQIQSTDRIGGYEALRSLFLHVKANHPFYSSMLASSQATVFRERMLQIIMSTIQKQLDLRGINEGMDAELITHFTASAFVGSMEWWIRNGMPHSPQYMAEQLMSLFVRTQIFEIKKQ